MSVRIYDKDKDGNMAISHFTCPSRLFSVPLKNGKTNEENEKHILQLFGDIFGGNHIDSLSVQADGGIVKNGLLDSLSENHPYMKFA